MDSNLELQWKKSLVSLPFFYYLPGKERTETGLFSSCAWLGCSRNMNQRQKLLPQFIRPGIANGRWWRGRRELILSGTAQTSKCFTVGGREGGSDAVVVGVEVYEETLSVGCFLIIRITYLVVLLLTGGWAPVISRLGMKEEGGRGNRRRPDKSNFCVFWNRSGLQSSFLCIMESFCLNHRN